MKSLAIRFLTEESGQDIIEYAILLVVIALLVVSFAAAIDDGVNAIFSETVSAMDNA